MAPVQSSRAGEHQPQPERAETAPALVGSLVGGQCLRALSAALEQQPEIGRGGRMAVLVGFGVWSLGALEVALLDGRVAPFEGGVGLAHRTGV